MGGREPLQSSFAIEPLIIDSESFEGEPDLSSIAKLAFYGGIDRCQSENLI